MEHSNEWYERFVSVVLVALPTLSYKSDHTCRLCFRTFIIPCLARGCEFDHFDDDEPGVPDE